MLVERLHMLMIIKKNFVAKVFIDYTKFSAFMQNITVDKITNIYIGFLFLKISFSSFIVKQIFPRSPLNCSWMTFWNPAGMTKSFPCLTECLPRIRIAGFKWQGHVRSELHCSDGTERSFVSHVRAECRGFLLYFIKHDSLTCSSSSLEILSSLSRSYNRKATVKK